MTEDRAWYTYREAAARVGRSVATIKRWRRNGMAMSFDRRGRRIVEHHTLLAYYRGTLERDNKNRKHQEDEPRHAEDFFTEGAPPYL